ncbi:Valine--tRNA ligase [Drechslerella dactyloides]|uniref:valine--tRNA ligase n=1 Tax=Drechslerella dactyloides TaxID=74499 RepID=A0AAD6NN73_DREDA|nr:Valine--tRNA ligase [Drechslerella dactyloides]
MEPSSIAIANQHHPQHPEESGYQPKAIEQKWYEAWERERYFIPFYITPKKGPGTVIASNPGNRRVPPTVNGNQRDMESTCSSCGRAREARDSSKYSTTEGRNTNIADTASKGLQQAESQSILLNNNINRVEALRLKNGTAPSAEPNETPLDTGKADLSKASVAIVKVINGRSEDSTIITNGGDPDQRKSADKPSQPTNIQKKPEPKVFSIVIPPPNITGPLHCGHALGISIEDTLARWHRMRGYKTLFIPGTDHAGTATEVFVGRKILRDRNRPRTTINSHKFVHYVEAWKCEYRQKINETVKRLGASTDWNREAFTMDEERSLTVTEAFVRLHKAGLIYRQRRVVNWCPTLRSSLTDLEVETMDIPGPTLLKFPGLDKAVAFGWLYYFKYLVTNIEDDSQTWITLATTRPETLLGDTAIGVHPNDERYQHLIGLTARHPYSSRLLPIVADAVVDPNFGTGMIPLAPAHDLLANSIRGRCRLPAVVVFRGDGTVNEEGEEFKGQHRFEVRESVIENLKARNLFIKQEPCKTSVLICKHTGDIVEPMMLPLWWLKTDGLADAARCAVREGKIRIQPKRMENEFIASLENSPHWCISRQMWWGHKVPAWYLTFHEEERVGKKPDDCDPNRIIVGRTRLEARVNAMKKYPGRKFLLEQDTDILDTWFSSALWPLAVLGWRESTPKFKEFFPLSILNTGADTLHHWVTRMVMLSLKLTGQVPFHEVYFHPLIIDVEKRKMSKSLGNGVDPLDIIEGRTLDDLNQRLLDGHMGPDTEEYLNAQKLQATCFPNGIPECGADALRFALLKYTSDREFSSKLIPRGDRVPLTITSGKAVQLNINDVANCREFCNSIYEIFEDVGKLTRLIPKKLDPSLETSKARQRDPKPKETEGLATRSMFHMFSKACKAVNDALAARKFAQAAGFIHRLWIDEIRDHYMMRIQADFRHYSAEEKVSTVKTLYAVIERSLRLTHPFMPFITEELWQKHPFQSEFPDDAAPSIMVAPYPESVPERDGVRVESAYGAIMDLERYQEQSDGGWTKSFPETDQSQSSEPATDDLDDWQDGVPVDPSRVFDLTPMEILTAAERRILTNWPAHFFMM